VVPRPTSTSCACMTCTIMHIGCEWPGMTSHGDRSVSSMARTPERRSMWIHTDTHSHWLVQLQVHVSLDIINCWTGTVGLVRPSETVVSDGLMFYSIGWTLVRKQKSYRRAYWPRTACIAESVFWGCQPSAVSRNHQRQRQRQWLYDWQLSCSISLTDKRLQQREKNAKFGR